MLVSVIIPVFNGEKYLSECLESVKSCYSAEIECIIVNDGSNDGTEEICRRFTSEDIRFRHINKDNSGVSDSRNIGMDAAMGDYLLFLDADDFINVVQWPEILSHAKQGDFDMIAYGYYNLFSSGNTKEEQFPGECDIVHALLSTTMLNTCWGKLLRREIITKYGLNFRKELKTCEDAIFILDFAQKSESIMLSNRSVLFYRVHSGGVMRRTEMADKLSDLTALFERRLRYISSNYNESSHKAMCRQSFSIITDLFRSCARSRKIREIRREYIKYLRNPTVMAIMSETEMAYLAPVYKKFEYMLMSSGCHTCLAVYFAIKSRLTHEL